MSSAGESEKPCGVSADEDFVRVPRKTLEQALKSLQEARDLLRGEAAKEKQP